MWMYESWALQMCFFMKAEYCKYEFYKIWAMWMWILWELKWALWMCISWELSYANVKLMRTELGIANVNDTIAEHCEWRKKKNIFMKAEHCKCEFNENWALQIWIFWEPIFIVFEVYESWALRIWNL